MSVHNSGVTITNTGGQDRVTGNPLWNSGTSGNPGARLVLLPGGGLAVYGTGTATTPLAKLY